MPKKKKKGLISKRLGVDSGSPLTKAECRRKVAVLKRGLKAGKYKGEMLRYAKYYAAWYAWKATKVKQSRVRA